MVLGRRAIPPGSRPIACAVLPRGSLYGSTVPPTPPYTRSVPHISTPYTRSVPHTSTAYATIPSLSTAHRTAPYAVSVPLR
eukprot:3790841-Rhodomonas_salina.1